MTKRINHIMVENDNIDDVGLARDLVKKNRLDIAMQLGKHANDHAFSFYVGTPSKWLLELGCDRNAEPSCESLNSHQHQSRRARIPVRLMTAGMRGVLVRSAARFQEMMQAIQPVSAGGGLRRAIWGNGATAQIREGRRPS